jgi:hypothetical protein
VENPATEWKQNCIPSHLPSGNVELPRVFGMHCSYHAGSKSMIDHVHQLTVVQRPEVNPPENETSLVPNRVLRHLYTTFLRFRVVAPHLPIPVQSCVLAEIMAATCARKHDRLVNAGAAARLAYGESFAELLKTAPAASTTHDALPSGVRDPFSLDQFAATMAFISKLRGEESIFFVLMGKCSLDKSFRHVLRACGESRLPVLFYIETRVNLAAGKRDGQVSEDPRSACAEFGVPVITADVHDPVALYRVTTEALHNARFGRGTTMIESTKVIAAGKNGQFATPLATPNDPLDFMRSYMEARDAWDDDWAKDQHRVAVEELEALAVKCD